MTHTKNRPALGHRTALQKQKQRVSCPTRIPTNWDTVSITALPTGFTVTFDDDDDDYTLPAIAVLLQTSIEGERIVLGVLNPRNGEIEAVDVNDGKLGWACVVRTPDNFSWPIRPKTVRAK